MHFIEILLIAAALSCDAMVCCVIYGQKRCTPKVRRRNALLLSISFGAFQFLMPVIGFFGGKALLSAIDQYDHWIAFVLLCAVSFSMVREGLGKDGGEHDDDCYVVGVGRAMMLAVATSIDALAVGITIAMLDSRIFYIASVIGIVCFLLSVTCFYASSRLSGKIWLERVMNFAGALVLMSIGARVLVEHGVFG
ncbi:MAG: manganese efflux pump MntP family protein [Succinivibrio sp.]